MALEGDDRPSWIQTAVVVGILFLAILVVAGYAVCAQGQQDRYMERGPGTTDGGSGAGCAVELGPDGASGKTLKLIYAYSPACRWCNKDAIRDLVKTSFPSVQLDTIDVFDQRNRDRVRCLGVDVTPTAILVDPKLKKTRLIDASVGGIKGTLEGMRP
jgi:hypothetical protein